MPGVFYSLSDYVRGTVSMVVDDQMYLIWTTVESCVFKLHRRTQGGVVRAPVKFEQLTPSRCRDQVHLVSFWMYLGPYHHKVRTP